MKNLTCITHHPAMMKLTALLQSRGLRLLLRYGMIFEKINNRLVPSIYITSSSFVTGGSTRCSTEITLRSSKSLLLANFDRVSAWDFSRWGQLCQFEFFKVGRKFMTSFRYAAKCLSLATKLPLTLFTTASYESLLMVNLFTCNSLAKRRPARSASYFATLLDAFNPSLTIQLSLWSSGLSMTIPAPEPASPDDPSTKRFQVGGSTVPYSLLFREP